MSYKIIGRVTTKKENDAIPGLNIQVWDKDIGNMDEYIGDTITDKLGEFSIEFTEEDFSHWGKEEAPDIYFIVTNKAGAVIYSTEETVAWDVKKEEFVYLRIPKEDLDKKPDIDPKDRAEQIRRSLEG